jgi:hypothetical protein
MPRTRSYHNHHPALTVEYSASTLSRWGFFPAILRYLQRLELPQRLRGVTIPSAPNAHFKPVDKLMTLVTVFITGIARISHIDRTLAGETALARTLGLDRFPCSDTLYNLLGKVTAWHVKQLDRIHRAYLDEQARFDQGSVIADLDLSVKSTEGHKRQGATPGYNPHHKGRDCYQWAVAFASGVVVWHQLYEGGTVRPGRGEARLGGPAAADASPEHPPARRWLPVGEGIDSPGVPARRFLDQGGGQAAVDPHPAGTDPTGTVAVVR